MQQSKNKLLPRAACDLPDMMMSERGQTCRIALWDPYAVVGGDSTGITRERLLTGKGHVWGWGGAGNILSCWGAV